MLTADPWETKPESGINIAFTLRRARGDRRPRDVAGRLPARSSAAGMAARAELLGDVGESAPEHWEAPFGRGEIHVLVMISAQDPAALAARDAMLREAIERHGGITVVGDQAGSRAARRRRALRLRRRLRPAVDRGQRRRPAPGPGRAAQGRRLAADPRRRVHPRLPRRGERDPRRAGARPAQPPTAPTSSTASCARTSPPSAARSPTPPRHYPGGEEQLAAKLVGRWRDGTPLDLSPDRPDPARGRRRRRATTPSPTSTTRTACAAPPAATSAAPTRATACRSRASSSTATA